jgi:class 3 adenylate cyclase
MEPEIRYFTSSHDGARLAYTTFGDGPLIVQVPRWGHCIEWMSKEPEIGEFYEKLARNHRVVIIERRGTGLAQRDVTDFSMEAHVGDLRSLVEHLKLERFALFGAGDSGGVCITYAAQHPEEVSHLILWGVYADPWDRRIQKDDTELPPMDPETWTRMIRHNWPVMTRLIAVSTFPSGPTDRQRRTAALWVEWISSDVAFQYFIFAAQLDVATLLPSVSTPSLVIHRRNDRSGHAIEGSRGVAAALPDARFVGLDEGDALIAEVQHEQVLSAIEGFLAGGRPARSPGPNGAGTAVILFADIVDSTAITERIGDAAFHERSAKLHASLRDALSGGGGRVVEGRVLGDGVLAIFDAAKDAIAAATACHQAATTLELQLHVGVHAGDVIRGGNNVHGGAVNIAARVAGASAPGETLVSEVIRHLARTSAGVTFVDRGDHALKGIDEPLRLYAVSAESS